MKLLFMRLGNSSGAHLGEVDHQFGFRQVEFAVYLKYSKGDTGQAVRSVLEMQTRQLSMNGCEQNEDNCGHLA